MVNTMVKDPKTGFFLPKSKWREQPSVSDEGNNTPSDNLIRLFERQLDRMEAEIAQLKTAKPGNSMSEMFALIIQAKELIAPQQANQSTIDVQTLFNAMTKGIDLVNEKEKENDQPIWVSLIGCFS